MIGILIALVLLFVICFVAWVYLLREDLANWIDDVEEFKEKPYIDNSEYDWGHNIKNYINETL